MTDVPPVMPGNEGERWEPLGRTSPPNTRTVNGRLYFRCDGLGCEEAFPADHDELGADSFHYGRWLGWVFLDLNRPDLCDRDLRFCSVGCCHWWLENQTMLKCPRPMTTLDVALRSRNDELAVRRAIADPEAVARD